MKLNCVICEKEFTRYGKQALIAKCCSSECLGEYNRAKPNVTCTTCNKDFHMKESRLKRYPRTRGVYCSKECQYEDLKDKMKGESNHQYGIKGSLNSSFKGNEITRQNNNIIDIMVYKPDHFYADKYGRVVKHRLLVEENYKLFNIKCFDLINNIYYLKKGLDVHHKDNNHDNNEIDNLQILTRSEHTKIHNLQKIIERDDLGKITGVVKSGEFRETPEVDNPEPSTNLND